MLKVLGVETHRELALLLTVIALVAISPLGREGTAAPVLVCYRLLLIAITIGSVAILKGKAEPEICPFFIALCGVVLLLMLGSVAWNPGSPFEGVYRWYQVALFGAAFLAMAAMHRQRSIQWKRTVLWCVIGIDLIYLVTTLIIGRRPLLASFVNPNYFASFLLVGFCATIAIVLFDDRPRFRVAAAGFALLLYFGMTQAWSRGATVAAIGVVVLAGIRFSRGRRFSRAKIAIGIVLALLAGVAASPSLVRKFLDRGQIDPYNYQRPQLWMSAVRVIAENPLLGVGPAEYYHVSRRFSPPVEGTVARYLKRPGIAHSEYLQFAAECGLPAAALLFTLAGYLVYRAVRRTPKCHGEQRVFQEAAILTAAGLGVHALVDNNWDVPVMAAGLVVFSLADSLPLREWRLTLTWSPRAKVFCALVLVGLLFHAVLIPGAAVYFNEAAQVAYSRGDVDRSESFYRLAAAISPDCHIFLDNAGIVYLDKFGSSGDRRWLDFAETLFMRAVTLSPNAEEPRRHLERSLIPRLTGDPEKDRPIHLRIAVVDRGILEIDPFNPFTRKNLAEALYNSGSKDAALQELLRAIEFEPNFVPAYLQAAEWFSEAGNAAASDDYRRKGLAIATQYQNLQTIESYEALLLGRPDRAYAGGDGNPR